MMIVRKSVILGCITTLIIPIVGVIYSFFSLKKENSKWVIINISLFVFIIVARLPPYQDLFRRYTETYFIYNVQTNIIDAIRGHVDILLYLLSFSIKYVGLPFYVLPAFLSSITVYCFLNGVSKISSNVNDNYRESGNFKIIIISLFFLIPVIQMALGVRWGAAIALMFYGSVSYLINGNKKKGVILFILACSMHFSMILLVASLFTSLYLKINRFLFFIYSIVAIALSNIVLPFILTRLGIIGEYASVGYAENDLANNVGNINTQIVTWVSVFYALIFTILVMLTWKKFSSKELILFRNYTFWIFIFCCLISVSFVPFRRYVTGAYYFFVLGVYCMLCIQTNKIKWKYLILGVSIFSLMFNGIYLQRRALLLGEVWKGLYEPSILLLQYGENDYKKYLSKIDEDGDWIGNKVKVN
ncbi:TPA: EpsG family protein [Klebsiella pneumoniae]